MCFRFFLVFVVFRIFGYELDFVGYGGVKFIVGKVAIGVLEFLGKVVVVVRDGEGVRVGFLVYGYI